MTKAITINNKICCTPIPVETTPVGCKNPVLYILEMAIAQSYNSGSTISAALTTILNEGFISSKAGNSLCCPDCTEDLGYYFLGGSTPFATVFQSYLSDLSISNGSYPCCVNYEINAAGFPDMITLLESSSLPITCCDTNFAKVTSEFIQNSNMASDFLGLGIVEASSFFGLSLIDQIVNLINSKLPYASQYDIDAVFNTILTLGIGVKCADCNIIVASAATFVTLSENLF